MSRLKVMRSDNENAGLKQLMDEEHKARAEHERAERSRRAEEERLEQVRKDNVARAAREKRDREDEVRRGQAQKEWEQYQEHVQQQRKLEEAARINRPSMLEISRAISAKAATVAPRKRKALQMEYTSGVVDLPGN
ncbi:hypothetical protein BU16DRAFT_616263 [Lophium mytilinum]|uniref:Uncharacterized protein n=1 Tax=Lophium mytilinum TaxID=390894 RepID=A0A6A6QYX7_9PEZI|nr:hypothetical protein BU16DRAFT_616263 [Lophium mytilinum]